jgi:hypothetical protein
LQTKLEVIILTDKNKPSDTNNQSTKKGNEKFEVSLNDLQGQGKKSLDISLADLPADTDTVKPAGREGSADYNRRTQISYCYKCGQGSQIGSKYCSHCGKRLASSSRMAKRSQGGLAKRKKFSVYWLVSIIFIFLLLGSAGAFYYRSINVDEEVGPTRVPEDYNTIQGAIDAANDGDIIVVNKGIYYENICFRGKNIVLQSEEPENPETSKETVIDGGRKGPVISFRNGEGSNAELRGFTIKGGKGDLQRLTSLTDTSQVKELFFIGGGILILNNSSPIIENNFIMENDADFGGGIAVLSAQPVITNNEIINNKAAFFGGAIYILESPLLTVTNNTFKENEVPDNKEGSDIWPIDDEILNNNTFHIAEEMQEENNNHHNNQ